MQRCSSWLNKILLGSSLLFAAAATIAPVAQAGDYPHPYQQHRSMTDGSAWWRRDVYGGAAHIIIDLSEQRAYFYKGDQLAGISPISTGVAGNRTPTGSFRVSEKELFHRSNLYGHYVDRAGFVRKSSVDVRVHKRPAGTVFRGASMDFFMRINGAVSMHAGKVTGRPESHGCIRLPWHMAKIFYENAPMGTKVTVRH
ncbi:L,D-transpeptidase family protein [Microbulbifer bruguierae]|uniref:L,D-transpeptidase family protein n=1 Tax=Microbulbifer bruguierae TaxID=3029061 RepID=A0ABY8NI38_9GAMM|nr:L,D-transpeptidase family protein [Microbulbifer bruguierae]WGL18370.1 L,D-transpeptidase family protein [Microbulbifer bruguierae]